MKDYDILFFIGRFAPFHRGHRSVVDYGLQRSNKVCLLIGSSQEHSTPRNPFSLMDRMDMVDAGLEDIWYNIDYASLVDYPNEDHLWAQQVRDIIKDKTEEFYEQNTSGIRIGLLGYEKDATSYYLKLFPELEFVAAPAYGDISATQVREKIFRHIKDNTPVSLLDYCSENVEVHIDVMITLRDECLFKASEEYWKEKENAR